MKKDIPIKKVEHLAMAVAPRNSYEDDNDLFWDVFIINTRNEPITDVIVNSRGYGEREGEDIRTSQFRFYFPEIKAKSALPVEQIKIDMFDLTSEYWVSFSFDNYLYDKKYIFVQGSLNREYLTNIPYIGKKGVMIR